MRVRERSVGGKIPVTTLLDPRQTPSRVLKSLYQRRWQVELKMRNIKTTLGMERLRCRTPANDSQGAGVYLLAYNVIRLPMSQAALLANQLPRPLRFKHTVQVWISWQQRRGATDDGALLSGLMILITQPRVGLRPGEKPRTNPEVCPQNRPAIFASSLSFESSSDRYAPTRPHCLRRLPHERHSTGHRSDRDVVIWLSRSSAIWSI